MSILKIDGMMLKEMFLSAAALLEHNRQSIDALNVFPVPDGDTGTNMMQTMVSAVKEIAAKNQTSVSDVANSVAKGALKGARGNSGVILSQILRGISRGLDGLDAADASDFVRALKIGSEVAYKAVMKPKEGTILTVQRVIAEETEKDPACKGDVIQMMDRVVKYGEAILRKTPEMLLPLKQAGVVDSGGKGLLILYQGMLMALRGESAEKFVPHEAHAGFDAAALPLDFVDDHESLSEIKFAYCTEFIVSHPNDDVTDNDVAKLRRRLERIGDCVLVVGDLEVIKVHVHTNEPGRVLQMALELGEIDAIKIDNMLEEFRERQKLRPAEQKEFGIVAVALGNGLTEVFQQLQVDRIVDGGQTMNPSIDDLLKAIESIPAKSVFVLPNNTNIILAAQQAADLTDKTVCVLPTKSVPMGIAAAIAFMPEATFEENCEIMRVAAEKVHTASITYAVRDTTYDSREIHQGDIMGLLDNKLTILGSDADEVAEEIVSGMVSDDTEVISIYFGEDVSEEKANALAEKMSEKYNMCDVNVLHGGQPLYYYLIAVE
ncbi:MAG: DAK2 domain-containing protein [Christensenellales bacterium]